MSILVAINGRETTLIDMSIVKKVKKIIKKNALLYKMVRKIKHIYCRLTGREYCLKKREEFLQEYSVNEIVMQQNHIEGYNRLDIFVRLLAVECEYGLNDFGWNLYRKMQKRRSGNEKISVEDRVEIFKKLIKSWAQNGYDKKSEIWLDQNLMLDDGSHRLALAIYHKLDKINCHVLPIECEREYSECWFRNNGFTQREIQLILAKKDEILKKIHINISCILWPPVKRYFEEITKILETEYCLREIKDIRFEDGTFERFVQEVYSIDDIEQWKIDKKKEYMAESKEKVVRCISLEFMTPKFRYKDLNHHSILTQGEELKAKIRNIYKNKIDNYFYDIICHTADNTEQSEYIEKLCKNQFLTENCFEKRDNL